MIIASNIARPFTVPEDGWISIATAGEYPHEKGRQIVSPETLRSLVSAWDGDGRKPIPVDKEHALLKPEGERGPEGAPAYAWIEELQVRGDELYGRFRWTDVGAPAVEGGRYRYLSPAWPFLDKGRDVIEPTSLHSVALTNDPNLPGKPISNSRGAALPHESHQPTMNENELLQRIIAALGLPETATADDVVAQIEALKASETEMSAEIAANRKAEAETLADKHGIAGNARAKFVETFAANSKAARELLGCIQPTASGPIGITQRQPGQPPVAANSASAVKLSKDAERDQLVAGIRKETEGPFDAAWAIAQARRPDLFS